jgi:hypothetical protein
MIKHILSSSVGGRKKGHKEDEGAKIQSNCVGMIFMFTLIEDGRRATVQGLMFVG